jgi:two-component system sensor histidine kinase CiaH
MVNSATTRLTLAYLAIIMAISLFFSITVYRVSMSSLEEGLRQQTQYFEDHLRFDSSIPSYDYEQLQNSQLSDGRHRIIMNLLGTNIFILVLAGAGSYWLAMRTLRPIEQALDAQSRFTADASHELRTPLTAMQTEIEVALRDKQLKMGEAKELLQSNLEEIAKLRALADGLLSLSRHQSGERVAFSEVSAEQVVGEARDRLALIAQQTKAKIAISGDDFTVDGDAESLVSLFVILVENAIKYSKETPSIRVTLEPRTRSGYVRVIDKGIGIKATDLPYIFNRFFRADTSRSKSTEGYGLGLSIAKQIVDMHSGSIEATSAQGEGTELLVKLPFKQPKSIIPA